MVTLKQRTFTKGSYAYTIRHVLDESGDINHLKERLKLLTRAKMDLDYEERQQKKDLKQRILDFESGDWHLIGITVDVTVKTATGWAEPPVVGRASLWGIESDSGDAFLSHIEKGLIEDSEDDTEALRDALSVRCAA
jgi:hypothetical protein